MQRLVSSRDWLARSLLAAVFASVGAAAFSVDTTTGPSPVDQSSFGHGDWPFSPPVRPALPPEPYIEWAKNPIDLFIRARLQEAGLKPSAEADKRTLLRRVTHDLTGLPPTPEEITSFLVDDSPEAFARVVDRLLASPRFGERWAQHWLDLVRFAETEGFKADGMRENAFRYRDYVIDSFNEDRPFDEFIRQQIAGDELEPDNPDALIATGFLRLYPDEDNAANLFQRRQEILDDVTDTTGLVFMGLTMGCAQCHDHKFDDILQTDYYRLQAFFVSMAEWNDAPAVSPTKAAAHEVELVRWQEASKNIRGEIQTLLQPLRDKLEKFNLEKYEPAIVACYEKPARDRLPFEEQVARMVEWRLARQFDEEAEVKKLSKRDRAKYAALKKELAEFDDLKPAPLPTAMAVCDVGNDAPPTHLLDGGNWKRPLQILDPGFPEFLAAEAPQEVTLSHATQLPSSTGRRSQLALWLTHPNHPLMARVIVNRLWQHHFGRGIVATPNDFGLQGEPPTHPELLDWLAVELVENGWSLKHIHRLMVTSAAFRMTSSANKVDANVARAMKSDPENKLLWHANRGRLEGEAIRDAMLQVAGELNLEMHGASARPALPAGVSERYAWEPDDDAAARNRRSVYLLVKRNMRYPLFEAFDQPDLHQSCARRAMTVTAPQSLAMLNSELTLELAGRWAERLLEQHGDAPDELIKAAFETAVSRQPSEPEIKLATAFLFNHSQLMAGDTHVSGESRDKASNGAPTARLTREAVADFCHGLFNGNEFITID